MPDLYIADVSEHQGIINWPAYPSEAVIVRLNYGANYPDKQLGLNISGARARCRIRGWYTYLVAGQAPEPQADMLASILLSRGGLLPGEFVACDDEEGDGDQAPRVHAYFDRIHTRLHDAASQDWVYSGLYFARTHLGRLSGVHRWLAAYGSSEMPDQHDLWQFTSTAHMAGIGGNVDCSVYHGSIDQLAALIGGTMQLSLDQKRAFIRVAGQCFLGRHWSEAEHEAHAADIRDDGSNLEEVFQIIQDSSEGQAYANALMALKNGNVQGPTGPAGPPGPPGSPYDDTPIQSRLSTVEAELQAIKAAIK